MNSEGLVKVYCKHQSKTGECLDMYDELFNCVDLEDEQMECNYDENDNRDDKRVVSYVTWTYYLINKQHLEVINEEET